MQNMKRKVFVEKQEFDAILSVLLRTKPTAQKKIKTSGKRGSKKPMFPSQSKS